jgi:hypothetical protein
MRTQASIKQLVGKAIAHYNRTEKNDASGFVHFGGSDASSFSVQTEVAKNDNVPWAKRPMAHVIGTLSRFGIWPDLNAQKHCNGTYRLTFTQPES